MMMECAKTGRLKKEGGFTLVELIIALTLLLLISLAFIPMFVYITEASQSNKARLVALKLASSKIEEIRALPYDQIGLAKEADGTTYDPAGVIPRQEEKTIDGRKYTITTDIKWEDDPSDNEPQTEAGYDALPYDYKKVDVAVESPSYFTGKEVKTANIHTLASMEGEEEAYPGGNIRVVMKKGWQTGDEAAPVEGAKVELTSGPSAPRTQFTDDMGKLLFAILDEGNYTVKASAPYGTVMMIKPGSEEQEVEVVEASTQTVSFEAEYPCALQVNLIDKNTDEAIAAGGTLILQTPFIGEVSKPFTAEIEGVIGEEFFGDIWPVGEGSFGDAYGLKVLANGYLPFNSADDPGAWDWDGTFSKPGETKTVTIRLTPANAGVKVIDDSTGTPVTEANVELYLHQDGSCSTEPVVEAKTSEDGTVSFVLQDNEPGASYCVFVNKDGYYNIEQHEAFRIVDGEQVSDGVAIDTYTVRLQPEPTTATIHVVLKDNRGNPHSNVRVRVQGTNFDEEKRTGSDGIASFTGLSPGEYTVSRRYWFTWLYIDTVDAESGGEYTVTSRY